MILLFSSFALHAQNEGPLQNGDRFPNIAGQFLTKEKAVIPEHFEGKISLLIIAFKRGTQKQIDTWTLPLFPKAKQNPRFSILEIPMISQYYNWMSDWIDNGMRNGIPENLHNNVLTYYGNLDAYYKFFEVTDKKTCYLFLLDEQGNIQYKTRGPATKEKLAHLNNKINSLLQQLQ
ncbi:MAG: hypothetical protein ACEPOZ_00910 [Marinifilaceae bacterium]